MSNTYILNYFRFSFFPGVWSTFRPGKRAKKRKIDGKKHKISGKSTIQARNHPQSTRKLPAVGSLSISGTGVGVATVCDTATPGSQGVWEDFSQKKFKNVRKCDEIADFLNIFLKNQNFAKKSVFFFKIIILKETVVHGYGYCTPVMREEGRVYYTSVFTGPPCRGSCPLDFGTEARSPLAFSWLSPQTAFRPPNLTKIRSPLPPGSDPQEKH